MGLHGWMEKKEGVSEERKRGEIIQRKVIWGNSEYTSLAREDKCSADTGDNLGKAQTIEE